MDKKSTHVTESNKHESELAKFQIFYEFATSVNEERTRLKRVRRRNDA